MQYQNVIENVVDTSDPKAYAEATIDTVVNSLKNQIAYNPAPVDPKVVEDAKRRLAELRGKPWTKI
jgi:hypothetical protein